MGDIKVNDLNPSANAKALQVSISPTENRVSKQSPEAPETAPAKAVEAGLAVDANTAKPESLSAAVARLNEHVQKVQRDLHFELDESSGKTVIKVINRHTQEVVRQIPNEVALNLARNLQDEDSLSLIQTRA